MLLLRIIGALMDVYSLCIIARAIFSWLPAKQRRNEFYEFLYRITEPVLAPVRKALPSMGGMDLSPLVVIVVLHILSSLFGS
jgi:YggT family protein